MANFKKFLWTLAALPLLVGCSDDAPNGGSNGTEKKGDVYARLALSLPSSRSQTTTDGNSTAGFEVGKDYENAVTSILVVLADKAANGDYNYIAGTITDNKSGKDEGASTDTHPVYTVTFSSEEIDAFAGKLVYVFAYCNPSSYIVEQVTACKPVGEAATGKPINDIIINLTANGSISEQECFLMSNHSISSIQLPTTDVLLKDHNTPDSPFFLGTVDVSRVAARFDFRQMSGKDLDGTVLPLNKYAILDNYAVTTEVPKLDAEGNVITDEDGNVIYESQTTEATTLMGYVTFDGMALMNEADNFFLLPRVSANGLNTAYELCGSETNSNFVVSPDAENKLVDPLSLTWLSANYLYNGIGADATVPYAYSYDSFTFDGLNAATEDDNDDNWDAPEGEDKTGYKIWKYVSENTIPGGNGIVDISQSISSQRIGVTTGIIFRAKLEAPNAELQAMMDGAKNIYCYDNRLIGDMAKLKEEVEQHPVSALAEAFAAACEANGITEDQIASLQDFAKTGITTRGEGLKIFRPENNQYYCYYIYRNRHNDNGATYRMGPMEFAVVRNNIYKIDIQNVLEFGHTKYSKDDPDPETPETPDEPNKAYFRLSVRVLPWVVRVNHAIL